MYHSVISEIISRIFNISIMRAYRSGCWCSWGVSTLIVNETGHHHLDQGLSITNGVDQFLQILSNRTTSATGYLINVRAISASGTGGCEKPVCFQESTPSSNYWPNLLAPYPHNHGKIQQFDRICFKSSILSSTNYEHSRQYVAKSAIVQQNVANLSYDISSLKWACNQNHLH